MAIAAAQRSLLEVIADIERCPDPTITLDALDPDFGADHYSGEVILVDDVEYIHRPLRAWLELGEKLGLRLRVPRLIERPFMRLTYERLPPGGRSEDGGREKYGTASEFARIVKAEEPRFVLDLREALARVELPAQPRVLDLGVNTGAELVLALALDARLATATLVGVDHSASALAAARARLPQATFVEADLATLEEQDLGARFDLVISIDTLHSPGIDDRRLLRHIVLDRMAPTGALILGFPNGRYRGGELEYGTRVVNLREPELGHLVKDVAFYRRYLQQHRRRVFVTGKHEVLVTAVPYLQPDAL